MRHARAFEKTIYRLIDGSSKRLLDVEICPS